MRFPWKYKESFVVALVLLVVGILVDVVSGAKVTLLTFPYNVIAAVDVLVFSCILSYYGRHKGIIQWMGSVPASVSAVVLFSVLSLLIGFVPQVESTREHESMMLFSHITSSWYYLFSQAYLMVTLAMVTARRAIPFKMQNIGFLFNHLGLLVLLVGMCFGAGDKEKLVMNLPQNDAVYRGYNEDGQLQELPFALRLDEFRIDDYKPSISLIDITSGEILGEKAHAKQFLVDSGKTVKREDLSIHIMKYYPEAIYMNDSFIANHKWGSVPAAFVKITDAGNRETRGWISCGNFMSPRMVMQLDDSRSLVLNVPQPKKYSSRLTISSNDGKERKVLLEVNRPVDIDGWKIYQTGFDERMGKWSDTSIVQVVKDPWLPVVYTGFYMLVAGAVVMFWKGRGARKGNETDDLTQKI